MARRLSTFQSSPASSTVREQTFEVVCSCGETLTGHRQPHPQTLACPHCQAPLFVLPVDCYAESARRPASSLGRSSSRAPGGVIEKINRLALWPRLRESRTALCRQVCSLPHRIGDWLKRQLSSTR